MAANHWTTWLNDEFGALHHWDLSSDPSIIRVFLLPGRLELDITFGDAPGLQAADVEHGAGAHARWAAGPC
jgi:hypothetical protein